MPRLHYYFIGTAVVGVGYGLLYRRWYLPYTTYQREMELVLEAEKFVSQQLLQRAERLQRGIHALTVRLQRSLNDNGASTSLRSRLAVADARDQVRRQLGAQLASVYALHADFEGADVQTALPKSLYAARLSKMKRRCCLLGAAVMSRDEPLSPAETLRCAAAFVLFVLAFRLLPALQPYVSAAIAQLLLLDLECVDPAGHRAVIVGERAAEVQREQSAAETEREKARQKRKAEQLADPERRRDDEISAGTDAAGGDASQRIVSVVHVSHWVEEFAARYALTQSPAAAGDAGVQVRYFDRGQMQQRRGGAGGASLSEQEQDLEVLRPDFCWPGLPWIADGAEPDAGDAAATVVYRPVTVAGVEQLLFNRDEYARRDAERRRRQAAAQSAERDAKESAISAEVAAALAAETHQEAVPDLLTRRRILLDPSRVKLEAAQAKQEAELRKLLYGGEASSEMDDVAKSKKEGSSGSGSNNSAARQRPGESMPNFVEEEHVENVPELTRSLPEPFVPGPLDACGWEPQMQLASISKNNRPRVCVTVGEPCLPDALWHTTLRQLGAQMDEATAAD